VEYGNRKATMEMHTLLLCRDAQYLRTIGRALKPLGVTHTILEDCAAAISCIAAQKFETIVVDWREIDDLAEFLCSVRRSNLNRDCILVAIVRDLMDLRQAFAAGVHFLIHKPASIVQIERCLRAAYCASVARRRRFHREGVKIPASVSGRSLPLAHAVILNLGEGGVGLRMNTHAGLAGVRLSVGDQVNLNFALPGTTDLVHGSGLVVWANAVGDAGVEFDFVPDAERLQLEQWLTRCLERDVTELRNRLAAVCA
jgi:ActR/RegA family two-component response regulator